MDDKAAHPAQPTTTEASVISQVAKLSPIGRCLQAALSEEQNYNNNNNKNDNHDEEEEEKKKGSHCCRKMKQRNENDVLTEDMAQEIQNAFGAAVASCWINMNMTPHNNNRKKMKKTKLQQGLKNVAASSSSSAPAALLQGEVKHYNRVGKQWRIVISNAEIRRRRCLNPRLKHRQRKSLWDHCNDNHEDDEEEEDVKQVVHLKGDVEILAYNDAS